MATNGSAMAASNMLESTYAPRHAPMAPGIASHTILLQSTLPNRQCEAPDIAQVPTSAMCTTVDASAGVSPAIAKSNVVDVTPQAIPKAPSTNWAIKPRIARTTRLRTRRNLLLFLLPIDFVYKTQYCETVHSAFGAVKGRGVCFCFFRQVGGGVSTRWSWGRWGRAGLGR